VAATEMRVIVMDIAVVIETINGALENTELIIATVDMVYDRVEVIIS
jgi:hypothetical protein